MTGNAQMPDRPTKSGPRSGLRKRARGFTLIEALAALVVSAVVVAASVGAFVAALRSQGDQKHAWVAFSIAQSKMEELGALDKVAAVLDDDTADTIPAAQIASATDGQCATGVDHGLSIDYKVDALGNVDANGLYKLCWKVTDGLPSGQLKWIRVVVEYPEQGGTDHVLLALVR